MTDTKALDALIESVEAGALTDEDWRLMHDIWSPRNWHNIGHNVRYSMHGSLDAANALHKALLPGCSQYSIVTDPLCLKVVVVWWPHGLSDGREARGEAWSEDDPARAWVIATLKAYRAGL